MTEIASGQPLRIAVVAVHGVGDQRPHETCQTIANCLLSLNRSTSTGADPATTHAAAVQYTPFEKTSLSIATRPVVVTVGIPQAGEPPGRFEESSPYVRALQEEGAQDGGSREASAPGPFDPGYDHGFMVQLLRDYREEGPSATNHTIRLEGFRLQEDGKPGPCVHLFEMYWADLSRVSSGFLRIFGDLYQLLFHVPDIGLQTADFALAEDPQSVTWRWLNRLHSWAARSLTLAIPILNLYLLAVVLVILIDTAPLPVQPLIVFGILDVAVAAALGWLVLRIVPLSAWKFWSIPILVAILLVVVQAVFVLANATGPEDRRWRCYHALALEWYLVAGLILALLLNLYARNRPGARFAGLLLGVPAAGVALWFLVAAENSQVGIAAAAFQTTEMLFLALVIAWWILLGLTLCVLILGWLAVRRTPEADGRRDRARRAFDTAWLSLVLPGAVVLVLILTMWGALYRVLGNVLPSTFYQPLLGPLYQPTPSGGWAFRSFAEHLFTLSGTPTFGPAFLLLVLGGVLTVWAIFPAAWAEVLPPRLPNAAASNQASARLGTWLTKGFGLLVWVGGLHLVAFAVLLPLGSIVYLLFLLDWPHGSIIHEWVRWGLTHDVPRLLGALLAGSAAGLLAFRGRLEKLALGFRPALDVAVDVDNYMREHPRHHAPRARICARYVSLLRYLCNWTDPRDGGQYAALIVVAHSQGTVITADLLRFLHAQHEAGLRANGLDRLIVPAAAAATTATPMPVYFFTVGCPLRQLYSVRVPHLYHWVSSRQTTATEGAALAEDSKPDPCKLGLRTWMNAYRSGDYVGRQLWRSDNCPSLWQPATIPDRSDQGREKPLACLPEFSGVSRDYRGSRFEFCVGPGAHTHYFDETSPLVATAIDFLVVQAARSPDGCKVSR